MNFKVGDKVRCVRDPNRFVKTGELGKIQSIGMGIANVIWDSGSEWHSSIDNIEKVEEPQEIKVGDVWASENKSRVVKIISIFENNYSEENIGYVVLKSDNQIPKGFVAYLQRKQFLMKNAILLHREPPKQKKQPKPQQVKAKKEEKWERVFHSNDVFRCGNKIKVSENGFEGFAECNKKDKFDLMFGVNLAAHRARVKYHQWVIEKMLKEGTKGRIKCNR